MPLQKLHLSQALKNEEELREEYIVRRNSMCKGPEAGRLVGRTKSKTIVIRAQKSSGHGCEVKGERPAGDRVCKALYTTVKGPVAPTGHQDNRQEDPWAGMSWEVPAQC